VSGDVLLSLDDLNISFNTKDGIAQVVSGVNLSLRAGMMSGLVGESGSGKSVTVKSILGLLPKHAVASRTGRILYEGRDLNAMSEVDLRRGIRGREIAMVFQDPMTALNPVMRVGAQIALPLRRHLGMSKRDAEHKSLELLHQVGIPDPKRRARAYPHELSGGQRQRVTIAIALSCDPKLLLADEPTTALDVTVQAQILDLFDRLREERSLAILLVSHDLGLIGERCEEVSVMYAGRIVERGRAAEVFARPTHPYSLLLEQARPRLSEDSPSVLRTIPGRLPDLVEETVGCAFRPRCPVAIGQCATDSPTLHDTGKGRLVSCWNSSSVDGLRVQPVDISARPSAELEPEWAPSA
jgi:peptide/nickel transport system permease protein